MANIDSTQTNLLQRLLARQVEANRAELENSYRRVLQETLFTNRSDVRPSMLPGIGIQEIDTLIDFLLLHLPSGVGHGIHLCQTGLGEQAVLSLGQVTRQFFLTHLENEQIAPALNVIDAYQNQILQGFIQCRERTILNEQERIRGALERIISRVTVEIKEVQALAQKATEANEFKSRFIARISHELRTPLGSLMGMAEMLQEDVYGPLTPGQKDITQRILTNSQALVHIFDELLDQSQIESGQLRLRDEIFSPAELVRQVHSNCLALALQKTLPLHLKIDQNLPRSAIGDRRRIDQILTNLVVNGIKYTETGSVSIQARKIGSQRWMLQVTDTGIGISKENQAYIFEPFRQADETISRKYGGVGLGLAIVKQLVTAMDGTVNCESEIGRGSTFTVILPLRTAEQ